MPNYTIIDGSEIDSLYSEMHQLKNSITQDTDAERKSLLAKAILYSTTLDLKGSGWNYTRPYGFPTLSRFVNFPQGLFINDKIHIWVTIEGSHAGLISSVAHVNHHNFQVIISYSTAAQSFDASKRNHKIHILALGNDKGD